MSADIVFPNTLPPPTLSGYSTTFGQAVNRVPRDLGQDRARREFLLPPRKESVTWDFSESEFGDFEAWFEVVVGAGTLDFDVQLSNYLDGLIWSTARFISSYKSVAVQPGDRWKVSADLLLFGLPFPVRTSTLDLSGRSRMTNTSVLRDIGPKIINGRASGSHTIEGELEVG